MPGWACRPGITTRAMPEAWPIHTYLLAALPILCLFQSHRTVGLSSLPLRGEGQRLTDAPRVHLARCPWI